MEEEKEDKEIKLHMLTGSKQGGRGQLSGENERVTRESVHTKITYTPTIPGLHSI